MLKIGLIFFLVVFLTSCTNVKTLNITRGHIEILSNHDISTFSDYGNNIVYDDEAKSYRYDIYIGGYGGCGGHLLIYAKPKMDIFMVENAYSNYIVREVHHQLTPPTKCKLFIEYISKSKAKVSE
ncbi:hypothetical protein OE749_11065 [Aestuariibacter sp. AA17]|uniref:Lipoprotein n=1 Tax=Fluctibacter corallii TaxID=2984329 RepID=A0ABT3AAC9_9ALTE|nr:hypothetical protein [Aestuariibacter sp. AA17]MCV2885232.1 hypothetical protein [Aestuariibacter sp. AA17]